MGNVLSNSLSHVLGQVWNVLGGRWHRNEIGMPACQKSRPEEGRLTPIRKVVAMYGLNGSGEHNCDNCELGNVSLPHPFAAGATTMCGVGFCGLS